MSTSCDSKVRAVSDRLDLLKLVREMNLTGVGAELGVAKGHYSSKILKITNLRQVVSIDRWSDHHDDGEYRRAARKLGRWKQRSSVLRSTFEEALLQFEDNYFDFIYIDGYAHTGQDGGKTLVEWFPKLKVGGIFSGYDYSLLWPKNVERVDEFVANSRLTLHVTGEIDRRRSYPSWFVLK